MEPNVEVESSGQQKSNWVQEIQATPRALSVRQISSRFTGNSVPVTEAEHMKKLRAYRKIPSFATVSKNSLKGLNSPRKIILMKEWSKVVIEDSVGEVNPQSALDFLAQYDVTQQGMDEASWKEWMEAIEHATTETAATILENQNENEDDKEARRPSLNHATTKNRALYSDSKPETSRHGSFKSQPSHDDMDDNSAGDQQKRLRADSICLRDDQEFEEYHQFNANDIHNEDEEEAHMRAFPPRDNHNQLELNATPTVHSPASQVEQSQHIITGVSVDTLTTADVEVETYDEERLVATNEHSFTPYANVTEHSDNTFTTTCNNEEVHTQSEQNNLLSDLNSEFVDINVNVNTQQHTPPRPPPPAHPAPKLISPRVLQPISEVQTPTTGNGELSPLLSANTSTNNSTNNSINQSTNSINTAPTSERQDRENVFISPLHDDCSTPVGLSSDKDNLISKKPTDKREVQLVATNNSNSSSSSACDKQQQQSPPSHTPDAKASSTKPKSNSCFSCCFSSSEPAVENTTTTTASKPSNSNNNSNGHSSSNRPKSEKMSDRGNLL